MEAKIVTPQQYGDIPINDLVDKVFYSITSVMESDIVLYTYVTMTVVSN